MMPSSEYLEEIWQLAKKQLPGWAYASLRSQARPKAGGRAAHRKENPNALERISLSQLTPESLLKLKDDELQEVWGAVGRWHKSARKQKLSTDRFFSSGQHVLQEMTKRKIEIKESSFVQELTANLAKVAKEIQGHMTLRHLWGPSNAPIAFIGTKQDHWSTDWTRDTSLMKQYLDPLGLSFDEIVFGNICPEMRTRDVGGKEIEKWVESLDAELREMNPQIVVALGKVTKEVLGEKADIFLPHPVAVEKHGDSGEIARKLKRIKKLLKEKSLDTVTDSAPQLKESTRENQITLIYKPNLTNSDKDKNLADVISENECSGIAKGEDFVKINKSDKLKQIVYAAVVDPYGPNGAQPDAHDDWIPPATVEETAHKYLQGPMVIGMQHRDTAKARVVESWVENYPSDDDYKKALAGEDHSVYRRKFGDDVVHSGSWMLGVKLGDEEWKAFEKGEINAFSPGGFGIRSPLSPSQMPAVNFIDLVPKGG